MKLDNINSHDLYESAYGGCKYFNQQPWDVAMNKKIAAEFEYFKNSFKQEVFDGKKDLNQYYVLLKLVLDGPMIFFEDSTNIKKDEAN